jgi:hypothetical protein
MYAAASAAMFVGVLAAWTPALFRVYWLFGAVLNVPYLFQGEVELLARSRRVRLGAAAVLYLATGYAAAVVWTAPVSAGSLSDVLPLGREVFGPGTAPHRLAQYYSFPAYFLLLGALVWSAWSMRGKPALRDRTVGVLGVALGATVVAVGSGVGAGFGVVPVFSLSLAAGVGLMYWGFLRAARVPSAPRDGGGAADPTDPTSPARPARH